MTSPVWMLFESGTGVEVNLSLYAAPPDRSRPIDAFVTTECEGSFTRSARRGAEAAYAWAIKNHPAIPPSVVSYDLKGLSANQKVAGESGGLAFAIALARHLTGIDPGPVAATGEIIASPNGGPVGPIRGIVAKLEAAARLLPEGGWVFYPEGNDDEVPDELRRSLSVKGLRVHRVTSVEQVLALLLSVKKCSRTEMKNTSPKRVPGMKPFFYAGAAASLAFGGFWLYSLAGSVPSPLPKSSQASPPAPLVNQSVPKETELKPVNDEPAPSQEPATVATTSALANDAKVQRMMLNGDSPLTEEIAQKTIRLIGDSASPLKKARVRRETVLEKEDGQGGLRSTLAFDVVEVSTNQTLWRVSVEGAGPAHKLSGKAAEILAQKITMREEKSEIIPINGFE
jgi:hypothetical protein